jgi:hypothetical protein
LDRRFLKQIDSIYGKGICNMRRTLATLTISAFTVGLIGCADMRHRVGVDYARNVAWPQPFRGADSNSVVAPFDVMRDNGWRENNTLGTSLFSSQHALNEAGAIKVQWIVTQAPINQRIVYVKAGNTEQETNARVESVQLAVSQLIPSGPLPQILVTEIEPATSSGAYQTLVHRALIKTTPTPRLSKFTGLNAPSQQTVAPNAGESK